MAHQSGRGGTITWDGISPNTPAWDAVIESWSLRYTQEQFPVPVMGGIATGGARFNPWMTSALGMASWTGNVTYLLPDDVVEADLVLGLEVIIQLRVNSLDYFWGTGVTRTNAIDCPLDGPIRSVVSINGIGELSLSVDE